MSNYNIKYYSTSCYNTKDKLLISDPNKGDYYLDRSFIEWFVGFVDAEGNFNIRLTDLKETTYKVSQFTFQIPGGGRRRSGLHIDDLKV